MLPRSPQLLIAVLATWRIGAVYQPLFTAFGPDAVDYRLGRADTKLVITDHANRYKFDGLSQCPPVLAVGGATSEHVDDHDWQTALTYTSMSGKPPRLSLDRRFCKCSPLAPWASRKALPCRWRDDGFCDLYGAGH